MNYFLPPPLERIETIPVNSITLDNSVKSQNSLRALATTDTRESLSGMRRGFLTGSPVEKARSVNMLQPDKMAEDPLVFPEVQSAMGRGWITDDLLSSISSNPALQVSVDDTEFIELLSALKSPSRRNRAMEVLKADQRLQRLFKSWMEAMGEHFEKLAGAVSNEGDNDDCGIRERKERTSMSQEQEGACRQLLNDPEVLGFIQYLQRNPRVELHSIKSANPHLFSKLEILIRNGMMSLQT